jgi:acetyl esterase
MPVTAATMRYFIDHYTPEVAQRTDWRASPLRAPTLQGAPPALVLTCGHDPLCDEARQYAYRLEREGSRVTALHLSDHTHGLLTMGKVIGATDGILAYIAAALRDAWRTAAGKAP